jgi:hypothetical protein
MNKHRIGQWWLDRVTGSHHTGLRQARDYSRSEDLGQERHNSLVPSVYFSRQPLSRLLSIRHQVQKKTTSHADGRHMVSKWQKALVYHRVFVPGNGHDKGIAHPHGKSRGD